MSCCRPIPVERFLEPAMLAEFQLTFRPTEV